MPQNGIYAAFEDGRRFLATDAVPADFQPAAPCKGVAAPAPTLE